MGSDHIFRYVEQNPYRAGMVASAADYPWSSAAAHCGLRDDPLLTPVPETALISDWARWLMQEDPQESQAIRTQTQLGNPCGDEAFLTALSAQLGRSVHPRPRGRPRKNTEHATSDEGKARE